MDTLLIPYLQATDESERQQCLDDLLLLHAAPAVRRALRQRLGFHVDQYGSNPYNQDAEDLYQEVLTKVIQTLNDLRSSPKIEIEYFRQYVSRATENTCTNYLRSKSPTRRRLKDKVRLLLLYHRHFGFWESEGDFLCGFAAWQRTDRGRSTEGEKRRIEEHLVHALSMRYATQVLTQTSVLKIMADLFELQDGPIEIDVMVNILVKLLQMEDHAVAPIDDLEAHPEPNIVQPALTDSRDDARDLLRTLWEIVQGFPRDQRDAFCFTFHDESGDDLFSLLIENGIVTLPEIAKAFDCSEQKVRRLRSMMPMDGATAAAKMNAPRAQLNKWRFRAFRRLKKELLPGS